MKPGDKVISRYSRTEGELLHIDDAGWAVVQIATGTLHTQGSNLELKEEACAPPSNER